MEAIKKERTIKKFTYKGKDMDTLLAMKPDEFV